MSLSLNQISLFFLLRLQISMQSSISFLYTTSLKAYGSVVSEAHSIVIALWSLALLVNDAHRFTGLSVEALEQLHEYRVNLHEYPDPKIIADMESNWPAHPYYKAYALYLIDELLVGSKSFNLSVGRLDRLFTMIYEEGIGVEATDYEDDSEESTEYRLSEEERKLLADQCREEIDQLIYRLTTNIRDIIYENTVDEKLPPAVKIKTNETNNTYFFSVDD